ncbi:hypothetical protein E1B28_003395 [Marasmius oreades]|uniref:Uncharacterized protein n=1 Tax=Marasmius oreades TaxID=181124 RepID=A0A9P7UMD7_9AGAR|nr:uncharacterized protein E1B28_003395 [Marasmius oreades]KAG7085861.1 hypothetical protein E1B28_003395 [Marasmius oreades]
MVRDLLLNSFAAIVSEGIDSRRSVALERTSALLLSVIPEISDATTLGRSPSRSFKSEKLRL